MYLYEWGLWKMALLPPAEHLALEKNAKDGIRVQPLYESDLQPSPATAPLIRNVVPKMRGPVYVYDDSVLELRCGGKEEMRGLVTFASVFFCTIFGTMLCLMSLEILWALVTEGHIAIGTGFERSPTSGDRLVAVCMLAMCGSFFYLYFRYGFRFSRLEMLTSRHLLVRFNRKTRQVHLHRPRSCGGIVTLPWEATISSANDVGFAGMSDIGLRQMLNWQPHYTGLPHVEMCFVGKMAEEDGDLLEEWAFIQRFMEEGPEHLPSPKLTSHFPWPTQAFAAQFEGVQRFIGDATPLLALGLVLMSPAFVVIGLMHWLSLLLCWKPRWPKVIREAGQPGKPTPRLTALTDYSPDIQQKLLANAERWAARPGSPPPRKPRARRRVSASGTSHEA